MPEKSMTSIENAVSLILSAEYVVALTGAGVSVESGVPPFRGPGGIWTEKGEPSLNGWRLFQENPRGYWEKRLESDGRSSLGRAILNAEPNEGHFALAEMEKIGVLKTLITQNIDGLHIKAGNKNVLEIHGSAHKLRCIACDARYPRGHFGLSDIPPLCSECGGVVKGDTVMFGEPIPNDVLYRCFKEVDHCDCMLVIGTSAIVHPAARFPVNVKRSGGVLIEVNPRVSELSRLCDVKIRAPSGEALPVLTEKIKLNET